MVVQRDQAADRRHFRNDLRCLSGRNGPNCGRLAFCQANRRCAAALGASPSAAGLRSAAGVPAADRATYLMTETGIDLTGQFAIVTGGGGGLGRACALRLADFGAALVIAYTFPARNAEVAVCFRAAGDRRSGV